MDCQPTQPQAGKAVLKRSLEDSTNLGTSPAKSQQRSARLSSNAAGAGAQRRCNLDALPDHLFRGILDTLSKKDVGATAATCERFATAWRRCWCFRRFIPGPQPRGLHQIAPIRRRRVRYLQRLVDGGGRARFLSEKAPRTSLFPSPKPVVLRLVLRRVGKLLARWRRAESMQS